MSLEFTEHSQASYYESGVHLWRTVIARALLEAQGVDLVPTNRRERRDPQLIRAAAIEWLTVDTWQLRCVYHLAQVSRMMEFNEWLRRNKERYGTANTDTNVS